MEKSKRILAFALAALMIFLAVPVTVFSAGDNPYEQYVGSANLMVSTSFCATGETTKIFVDIGKDSQMSAALFVLRYDASLLKAINVDTGLVLKNGHTSKNITEEGLVKVSYADINPNYEEGRLFEVEFQAIGEIPEGKHTVDLILYGNRMNTFGQLHKTNEHLAWTGPDSWRTKGRFWTDEYMLTRTGILTAPSILTAED